MEHKELAIYETEDGKEPFTVWYRSIKDKKTQEKIEVRLKRVQFGNPGDYKKLANGISELKFKTGHRIYFAETKKTIILLLLGGDKTRQSGDIEKAQNYWKDYKERYKNE